jgi:hypothetical protein
MSGLPYRGLDSNMRVPAKVFLIALLLVVSIVLAAQSEEIPIGRFNKTDYGDWTATGTAFQKGPVSSELLTRLEIENASEDLVASSEVEGDEPTGTLTSPEFRITKPFIAFRIAGGNYEIHTCLNLLVDGKVVKSATGWRSDRLTPASWDVTKWIGQNARIQIVDEATGDWGHLNVAGIVQTDAPQEPPLATGPLYHEALRPQFHFTARQWTMDRLNPGMREEGWVNDLNGLIYYEGEYHLFASALGQMLASRGQHGSDPLERTGTCLLGGVAREWRAIGHVRGRLSKHLWPFKRRARPRYGGVLVAIRQPQPVHLLQPGSRPHVEILREEPLHDRSRTRPAGLLVRTRETLGVDALRRPAVSHFHFEKPARVEDEHHPIPNSFECPDFFELPVNGDEATRKWVLVQGNGNYSIGTFNGTEFKEETGRRACDVGPNFYATQSWHNTETGDGRRIQIAWMRGADFLDMPFNQMISFPCQLSLHRTRDGLRVFRKPISQIGELYTREDSWTNRTLAASQELRLAPGGQLFHIKARVEISEGARLVFGLRGIPVVLTAKSVESGHKPAEVWIGFGRWRSLWIAHPWRRS